MTALHCDIAVIGDSLGGVLAAYSACRAGHQVVLASQYPWIGGQLTSQAVPPDEHRWIESEGCSASYRAFRQAVRDEIKQRGTLLPSYQQQDRVNPGNGWVSRICHEPAVAERLLRQMLAPYIDSRQLVLLKDSHPVAVSREGRTVQSVSLVQQGHPVTVQARYYLDGTDTGDLLPLADLPFSLGREAQHDTGERDAAEVADSRDQQPFTLVFALEHIPGEDFTIARPRDYDHWRQVIPPGVKHKLFSQYMPDSHTKGSRALPFFAEGDDLDWWRYRRIVDASAHREGTYAGDISLVNWPQNDYARVPLIGEAPLDELVQDAKQLNLCLLYWLQTEAPRPDGGQGYPGLRLAPEAMGTEDGIAQAPYVRESRRIRGRQRLTQNDILATESTTRVKRHANSVGIISYPMDVHPTCVSGSFHEARVNPFELPLGCLVPFEVDNLLPACKNLSVTHLVNACARVQPAEWLIGEVAGTLAAFCCEQQVTPTECDQQTTLLHALQDKLTEQGIPLHWSDEFY